MKGILPAAAALIAVAAPAQANMPQPPATVDKLEQLATVVEGMHGNSTIVDQRIADMLRPLAAAQGTIVPLKAAPYTLLPESALKLRPKGWLMIQEEQHDGHFCAGLIKWMDENTYGSHVKWACNLVPTRALVVSSAILRAWAQEMRDSGQ